MGIWNPGHSDVDCYLVLLGRSQGNGALAASGAWLFARNIQARRPHHGRPDGNGFRVHSSLRATLGDEQRCGMDFASRENESALARHGFDRGPGANSKSDLDPDFYSVAKLRHLPGDQPRLSPYSTA